MQRHARRSRLVAAGLSVGALVALVTGMDVTERVIPATGRVIPTPADEGPPGFSSTDPFTAGGPATPPSGPPGRRRAQTVTSAS